MTVRGQSPELSRSDSRSPFDTMITEVLIEGNRLVDTSKIRSRLLVQAGETVTEREVRDDVRSLYATGWFNKVEPRYRLTRDGMALVIKVTERNPLETRARAQSPPLEPLDRSSAGRVSLGAPAGRASLGGQQPGGRQEPATSPADDSIVDIRVEGNTTIESGAILAVIRSQVGRPADETQIKEDLRSLYATRWFYSVERRLPGRSGRIDSDLPGG